MVQFSSFATGLALALSVAAIPHKDVEGFEESAPDLFLKHKPYLKVSSGCVPFPAVNADGETSSGLDTGGDKSGQCSESDGQVYARGWSFEDKYAIMYAWYMPKDQPVHGGGWGHRHDWESIVVWLSSEDVDAEYLGIAWSGHGSFSTQKAEDKNDDYFTDSRPHITYNTNGITNHELYLGSAKGGEQPLIAWDDLTDEARAGLNEADFGDAVVPFKETDKKFTSTLAEASID